MSIMCKLNGECSQAKGMCIHEKMMAVMVMLGVAAAVAHWGLQLF